MATPCPGFMNDLESKTIDSHEKPHHFYIYMGEVLNITVPLCVETYPLSF